MTNARVLIIEDELAMRTAVADVLQAEGYRVLTAADGEIGLQCVISEKPDLVLLDLMMPRLDGYAVCTELRRFQPRFHPALTAKTGRRRVQGLTPAR
jgi:DNA-binding response OmpR family regulator